MFINRSFSVTVIVMIVISMSQHCFCQNPKSLNSSMANGFSPAVATWYGSPTGSGSGGACGFADDVATAPYNGMISAGNDNIFKSGKGCGSCYQVRCNKHPSCSTSPITLTITDQCPGACNNVPYHFDLSGKAFGLLAKHGQEDALRKAGIIDIEFQRYINLSRFQHLEFIFQYTFFSFRVPCSYKSNIVFKIDMGSNRNYLAFAVEYVNSDGDLGAVELSPSNSKPIAMKQSWGATWETGIPEGVKGPYSVKITTIESRRSVVARNVIPVDWAPGKYYHASVNL
ncbi:expansin-B6-like isoform X1 [Primulina huaijiensis]|uniref:expansin-B6-like isoform X1 n=1 Tax=Primulina huaijiensis TaxID=1492673 RepID=UPI003CC7116C